MLNNQREEMNNLTSQKEAVRLLRRESRELIEYGAVEMGKRMKREAQLREDLLPTSAPMSANPKLRHALMAVRRGMGR